MLSPVRMEFTYEVVRRADAAVAASGETVHAARRPDGRPCRLPERVRRCSHEGAGHRRRRIHRLAPRRGAARRGRDGRRRSTASPTTTRARSRKRTSTATGAAPGFRFVEDAHPGRRSRRAARRRDPRVPPRGAGGRAQELGTDFRIYTTTTSRRRSGCSRRASAGRSSGSSTRRARRSTATARRSRCARTRCRSRSPPTA